MKVALINDSHFGWKNDDLLFHKAFIRFYDQVFFPELRKRKITTIIHLGDLWDRRKYVNFHILYRTRIDFLQKLVDGGYDTHIILGNHDTYFKESNDVNSVTELLHMRYPKFHIYEEPQELILGGLKILMVPWLNSTNLPVGLDMIARSRAKVLMGHLEIAGFPLDHKQVSEHGVDRNIFSRYKAVFSGHYHHASQDGPVRYLGAQYQLTFADLNDKKGFHIFDTETLEIEFIENPNRMFFRLDYDDREEAAQELYRNADHSELTDKYVRVVVPYKTNPILYEQWIDKLLQVNPADLQISEQYSLDVSEDAEEDATSNLKMFETMDPSSHQTLEVINKYVDAMGMDIDRMRLKSELKELYNEATAGVVNVQ